MFERLAKNGSEFEEKTKVHVNEYADAGLRTLVLAYRDLEEEEFNKFHQEFIKAKNTVSTDRDDIIDRLTESIEKDLILLGATAVEDKLQNGVCFKPFGGGFIVLAKCTMEINKLISRTKTDKLLIILFW